jgi:hypothetical protein
MLYKRYTIVCDNDYDWGHFIDMDDMPINTSSQVCHKIAKPPYTRTPTFQWLSETCLMALEIPRIKDSCICSTLLTTLTVGSIMLCFIC